ncbi:hypothetical protein M422DRAFT_42801 [Sphaerobolus stellatus SS14]|nr:hypothetical protein M422DRAFT_42801 [Sphaerobolus stellatus SS14]
MSSPGSTNLSDISSPSSEDIPTNSQSVGIFDAQFSESRRKLLDYINKLQTLGVSRDFDLPQIVVIGSQSAGKSSLIESISGITLPRSSGTCTRCPTECRLIQAPGEQWRCEVSIRFTTDDDGTPLLRQQTIGFGAPIYDREEIEERIRRAQRAALNPGRGMESPNYFLSNESPPSKNMLDFTTNCISLEIRGPELTDLSFCDLPGLIASVSDDGREEDIEKVRELVSSYIAKESCIVLLTVACETDFETQGAYRLAKQYDPQGMRTIGVLTKPDRIPEGETGKWISLIRNERSALAHGWFCVKQLSSAELEKKLSFEEARRLGEEFFKNRPWSNLETTYQRQLGTAALTKSLSQHLLDLIAKRMPVLMEELQNALATTKVQLAGLPPPLSDDPAFELMQIIGEFGDEIFRHAEGLIYVISGSHERPARRNDFEDIRRIHEKFRSKIRATAPHFRPFSRTEEWEAPVEAPAEEPDAYSTGTISVQAFAPSSPIIAPLPDLPTTSSPIYLEDVVERVRKATNRELTGFYPYQVVKDLIATSTNKWREPAETLVDGIYQIILRQNSDLIEKHFGRYTAGGLRQRVWKLVHDFAQARREEAIKRVSWMLELESDPFTLNQHYLDDYRNKYLKNFKEERKDILGLYDDAAPEPWNPNQFALEIMATVRAYFQVAYKRVTDTFPLAVDRELIRIKKRQLQEAITKGLQITGPASRHICEALLSEPEKLTEKRIELNEKLKMLTAAQEELLSAGLGF